MSGQYGYLGIERFIKKIADDILKNMKSRKDRLPTYTTIFRVVYNKICDELPQVFSELVKESLKTERR